MTQSKSFFLTRPKEMTGLSKQSMRASRRAKSAVKLFALNVGVYRSDRLIAIDLARVQDHQMRGLLRVMETTFATHNGCVRNTAKVINHPVPPSQVYFQNTPEQTSETSTSSGLGGQIGELTAALNVIGWNHHQVPPDERIPPQERM